jgi:hypothetical protein
MWDVFIQASNDGAASSPDLAKYADGRALMTLNDGLARNKAAGLITKGLPRMAPMVTEIAPIDAPTTVTVTDCIDDSTWLQYRRDNGQLANDKPGGRQSSRATVTVSGGVWKVSSFGIQAVGTC